MKRLIAVLVIGGFFALVWQITTRLSADAVGMAIGVMFGIMAGIPAALLVMASGRRREEREQAPSRRQNPYGLPAHASPNAPIIVLAGGYPGQMAQQQDPYGAPPMRPALPGPYPQSSVGHGQDHGRQFKVVGEKEEWIDEW